MASFAEDYGHRTSSKGVQAATEGFNTGVKVAMSCLADTLVGESVSRVPLTLLTAMGSNATSWGMGDSAATAGISELLA